MPHDAQITRDHPGCLLFLVDQSGSMADPFGGSTESGGSKADEVAAVINRFLDDLVNKCTRAEGVRDYFDVGVIGYGASVGPAFAGVLAERSLVPLSEVADNPDEIQNRSRKSSDGAGGIVEENIQFPVWFKPTAAGGTPMAEAFGQAYTTLQDWIGGHGESFPPIVINITDGEATGADPEGFATSLGDLETANGEVLVCNAHLSSLRAAAIMFPDSEHNLPDQFAQKLFRMSSVLPERMREAAATQGFAVSPNSRAFVFNADVISLITFLDIGTFVEALVR
jgi:hypothetical protein